MHGKCFAGGNGVHLDSKALLETWKCKAIIFIKIFGPAQLLKSNYSASGSSEFT